MTESNGSAAKPDLVALREDIRQTRADLGATVQALAARADVKARAREQVQETKQRVLTQAATMAGRVRETSPRELAQRVRANPLPAVLLFAGVAAAVGVVLIVRGRR
jgi:ElaB/YqjD/DUF883 family membrane-anchored ribosome-binding protein